MRKFFAILILLAGCKPLQKAQQQVSDVQKLTDKIISSLPPVIRKDSTIFIPGNTRVERDTITNTTKTDTTTVINHVFTNNFYHSDTVKFFYQDIAMQQAQYREIQRLSATNDSLQVANDEKKKEFRLLIYGLFFVIVLMFALTRVLK